MFLSGGTCGRWEATGQDAGSCPSVFTPTSFLSGRGRSKTTSGAQLTPSRVPRVGPLAVVLSVARQTGALPRTGVSTLTTQVHV